MRRIKDFEGYSITSCGKVWSHKTNRFLKPQKHKEGYLCILLRKNGKYYSKLIHRLVAETYIPKTDEDIRLGRDCIDHKDGNKTNNNVNNLRYCTHKENNNFELAIENNRKAQKKKPVVINDIEYESIREAARQLDLCICTVQRRCNNPNFPNYQYKGVI